MPAYGSVSVVRAPSHELSTTSRSDVWSPSRLANTVSVDLRRSRRVSSSR